MSSEQDRGTLQAVEIARKPAQISWVPREIRDSIVARIREHDQPIGRVARAAGISANEVVGVLLDRWEREKEAARRQGYAEGKLAATFPFRPITGAVKRAA